MEKSTSSFYAFLQCAALALLIRRCAAYVPGDFVPVARRGQYHSMRTHWHDQLGRHCPRFAADREVIMPFPRPTGFTGADAYKVSFQFGNEKYLTPWLYLIGRQTSEVPMIDITLRYSGGDLLGATAKIVNMPQEYLKEHEDLKNNFWDPKRWPKHVIIRYKWVEKSEIDVKGGLYVLFGWGFALTLGTAVHILQSSKDKLSRFIKETVLDSTIAAEEAKVE